MIPAIGFMAGCYILVRMLSVLLQPPEQREPRVVQGAALLTIFVTIATMIGLWFVPAPAALR